MDATPWTLLLLTGAAFLAGTVDAIGGGGGLIALPALLSVGLAPTTALGTNKAQSVFGSGAALTRYARAGLIKGGRRFRLELAAGFLGSLAGAALVLRVPPGLLRPLVLVLLVVAAAVLVLHRPPAAPADVRRQAASLGAFVVVAVVLGAYDGFFGPGTGTFLILIYVSLFHASMAQASADAKVVNFASNLAAVALFSLRGKVLWSLSLPMAAGQLAGGWTGAHLVVRGGDRVVRTVALVVVVGLLVKMAFDLARA
jgi:uncharacterized membrane protein YfcA